MSIRRLLVPLDGTTFAEHAVPTAASLARRAGGSLILLHVRPITPLPSSEAAALADAAHAEERAIEAAAAYVRGVVDRERAGASGTLDIRGHVADGPLVDAIRATCDRESIDLVVLTAHAHGALAEWLGGSAARAIAHGVTEIPVLVLPGGDDTPASEPRAIEHVLAAIDADTPSTAVTAAASELARLTGAAITLAAVHARGHGGASRLLPSFLPAHPDGAPADTSPGAARAAARDDAALLDEIAERLAAHGERVSTRVLEDDDASAALVRCAEDVGADVIAVGTRADVADALRRSLEIPLLLAPPRTVSQAA